MTNVKVTTDFNNKTGRKIRPMHGVGQAPILGADLTDADVISTDEEYLYTMRDGVIKEGKLTVKAHSMTEIRIRF